LPLQCWTNFAQASGNHSSWILNQIQSQHNSSSNHSHLGNLLSSSILSLRQFNQSNKRSQFKKCCPLLELSCPSRMVQSLMWLLFFGNCTLIKNNLLGNGAKTFQPWNSRSLWFMKMFVSMAKDGEFWISNKRVFMKDVLLNSTQAADFMNILRIYCRTWLCFTILLSVSRRLESTEI
jgi:hypothetical protein